MTPAYITKLGLKLRSTNLSAQKIDGLALKTHNMTSASFSLQDSQGRVQFFEETFLLVDTNIKIVLEMPFLAFSNTNVEFTKCGKFIWRSYTNAKALSTTNKVELIDKKKFAKAAMNKNLKTFIIYVSAFEAIENSIHLF